MCLILPGQYRGGSLMRPSRISAATVGVAALRLGFAFGLMATALFAWARGDTPLVEAVDQTFSYTIGNTVQNGQPAAGAGNIENAGDRDIYTFTAAAGQRVFFDGDVVSGGTCSVFWELTDSSSAIIFTEGVCGDPGTKVLALGGTYTITVGTGTTATGTYSFRLTNVPAPDSFAINIGDTVQDGQPGAGAGNIETPGREDRYAFSATAGQTVFFDGNFAGGTTCSAYWELKDPTQAIIFDEGICGDPGSTVLALGGTYAIRVYTTSAATGTYSFRLTDVPAPDTFGISIGDTVQDGQPGVGAGTSKRRGARTSTRLRRLPDRGCSSTGTSPAARPARRTGS